MIIDGTNVDWTSEETQYKLMEFYDKLERCYLCEESWIEQYRVSKWYMDFN